MDRTSDIRIHFPKTALLYHFILVVEVYSLLSGTAPVITVNVRTLLHGRVYNS